MANKGFNGSTVSFNSQSIGVLVGLTVDEKVAEVRVSSSGDSIHKYVAGIPDPEVTVETIGGPPPAIGATGALAISWFDGSTAPTITNGVVTARTTKGTMDGEISGTIKIRPA